MFENKRILLIISGGIAAYKTLDLIRLIKKSGGDVRCILTKGGSQFVTPLSVSSLSENKVYGDLWSLTDEAEMGHIRLSRECDLVLVCPATADIMAKMAHGHADDLASTTLLASNKPIMIAPAMNPEMWHAAATQDNLELLKSRGVHVVGPNEGEMACGETGLGRMAEPEEVFDAIKDFFFERPLKGRKALVTSGPTYEAIDPVRFIGNRSSGKQGHAIAAALRDAGADVTLVSGPTALPHVQGVQTISVQSAREMMDACLEALPCDIAICAAAVGDWKPQAFSDQKMKKKDGADDLTLKMVKNPDILQALSQHDKFRPNLVIGFAAETEKMKEHAQDKLKRKGCDWIIANEVGADENGAEKAFGRDENQIYFISYDHFEPWEKASKRDIAHALTKKITEHFKHD